MFFSCRRHIKRMPPLQKHDLCWSLIFYNYIIKWCFYGIIHNCSNDVLIHVTWAVTMFLSLADIRCCYSDIGTNCFDEDSSSPNAVTNEANHHAFRFSNISFEALISRLYIRDACLYFFEVLNNSSNVLNSLWLCYFEGSFH